MKSLIPQEIIEQKILLIRGHRVILDRDLAKLYGVNTRRLNEQVKRNIQRFQEDFWRSQIATSNSEKMGLRRRPYAFTEHGAIMTANILNSGRAVAMRPLGN